MLHLPMILKSNTVISVLLFRKRSAAKIAFKCLILPEKNGGGEGDRTLDLRIANATLSQLSYSPQNGPEY